MLMHERKNIKNLIKANYIIDERLLFAPDLRLIDYLYTNVKYRKVQFISVRIKCGVST